MPEPGELTAMEKAAVAIGRMNEIDAVKQVQWRFHDAVTRRWVNLTVFRRTYVEGLANVLAVTGERAVMLAANHRSFFDQYVALLVVFEAAVPWVKRIYFPVRSNFFYERPLGIAMNLAIGGGTMYPPIFRDPAKSAHTKDGVERLCRVMQQPDTLVGVHPEGTRGKGPDPYELLPAQPGIGQIVLQAKPVVIPLFINGLPNSIVEGTRWNWTKGIRRANPCILVFGEPVDYSEYTVKKPRAALYKRTSDKIRAAIIEGGARERAIREACARGEISDDDPKWLANIKKARRG